MAQAPADLWTTQLKLLQNRAPQLAKRLATADASRVRIEPTRSGDVTAFLPIEGREQAIHSRYNPRQESEQIVASQLTSRSLPCVLVGVGLAYDVEQILDRISASTPLLLFEEDLSLLRAALSHRDLQRVLTAGNVHWFAGTSAAEVLDKLLEMAPVLEAGVQLIVPPISRRRNAAYVDQVQQSIDKAVQYAQMLRATREHQGRIEVDNLLSNLGRYATAETLTAYENCLHGRPAIVVAAGPSLSRNGSLLQKAKGKIAVIAVGAALKPLQRMGVQPDAVVHIDYSELCLRQFQTAEEPGDTLLIAGATAAPAVFPAWTGRVAMTQHPFAERLLESLAPQHCQLRQGTSVAHTAFYVAQYLGASPIAMVGLDLAFTDCVYYSAGNALHDLWRPELNRFCTLETKEWERLVRRKQALVRTADWDGRVLFTDQPMAHYLQQFDRDFAMSKAQVIDATEGGARKASAQRRTLADFFSEFLPPSPSETFFPRQTLPGVSGSVLCSQLEKARARFGEVAKTFRDLARQQEILVNPRSSESAKNKAFQRLDRLQQRVSRELLPEFQICSTYDPTADFEKQAQTQRLEAMPLTQQEKLQAMIRRDLAYTTSLARIADRLNERLRGQIQRFRVDFA